MHADLYGLAQAPDKMSARGRRFMSFLLPRNARNFAFYARLRPSYPAALTTCNLRLLCDYRRFDFIDTSFAHCHEIFLAALAFAAILSISANAL